MVERVLPYLSMHPRRRRGDQEAKLRERERRERRRVGALVGPGHNYDLAHDAPLGADPRVDNTGFCEGGVL